MRARASRALQRTNSNAIRSGQNTCRGAVFSVLNRGLHCLSHASPKSVSSGNSVPAVEKRWFATQPVRSKKILISDSIEKSCVDILVKAGFQVDERDKVPKAELLKIIKEYDGLIVRSGTQVTADVIKAGVNLKLIGRAGTGVDNIDLDAATKKGIMVMNTPGGNTASAAELTISLIMALSRNIPNASASLKQGKWDRKKFMGIELAGKTLGVVGLGQIGRRVAKTCQALGMKTIGYDPLLSKEVAAESSIELVSLDDLYAKSDFITLHAPLTADTRNLMNDTTFAKCKKGVRIVNCARGGIVDEDALLRNIESGRVAGAALDVFEKEPPPESSKALLAHPAIICTPHLGASTEEAQEKVAQEIATQFVDALEGRRLAGVVNSRILTEMHARKEIHPFVELAERMGNLQAQLLVGNVQKISLTTRGSNLKEATGILTAAALKGILSQITEENVNFVNAPALAQEFGLKIDEVHETIPSMYGSSVTITFFSDKETVKLVGTVSPRGQPRLVQIDDYSVELSMAGHALFFSNQDKPGVMGKICTMLGEKNINIANFALGRREGVGRAIGAIQVDSPVPQSVLDAMRSMESMVFIKSTSLPLLDDQIPNASAFAAQNKPSVKPKSPNFGSGPCAKRPGYRLDNLSSRSLGRSHRSRLGLSMLQQLIDDTRELLRVPKDYHIGIVPASDTGAFEMAMWGLLGSRPVDVCYWESFGEGWMTDITSQLKLQNVRKFGVEKYGQLPDLKQTNPDHDIVFTWNGTTSGVKVPNADWISKDRAGLTLCDATSAVFAMPLDWPKLDVVTYSWQKALGGEGAHGMLILSPRAVQRFESYKPTWPMPKIFRLTKKGKFQPDVFEGKVINTPSMLAVEDCLDALTWAKGVGGLDGMISRSEQNLAELEKFVSRTPWIHFLCKDKATRSNTSVCLTLDVEPNAVKAMTKLLETEGVAYDIDAYRDAPAGLRIWCGSTVEREDIANLCEWLKWAHEQVTKK